VISDAPASFANLYLGHTFFIFQCLGVSSLILAIATVALAITIISLNLGSNIKTFGI